MKEMGHGEMEQDNHISIYIYRERERVRPYMFIEYRIE